MARFKGTIATDISGSIGGLVFSHNKGGAYIRQRVTPTNPDTSAQSNARASFSFWSSNYHGLPDANKLQWQVFADTAFKPKFETPGIAYSGFNAYVSLGSQYSRCFRTLRTLSVSSPADITNTPTVDFAFNPVAPAKTFSSSIQTDAGVSMVQNLLSGQITTDGKIEFTIQYSESTGAAAPDYTDPVSGLPSGYAIYGSMPGQQTAQFVSNPEMMMLGAAAPPALAPDSSWTPTDTIKFQFADAFAGRLLFKQFYSLGNVVELSLYAVSPSGQSSRIGSVKVTVASSLV